MDELPRQEAREFFDRFGGVDEEVEEYVAGVLAETDEDTDPEDIRETLCGFCPTFEHLPIGQQTELVLELITAAQATATQRTCNATGATTSSAPSAETPPSCAAGAADPLPSVSGLNIECDVSRPGTTSDDAGAECHTTSRCEDKSQLAEQVDLLAGLCPGEGVDCSFLGHLLQQMCSNDIEKAAQWILDHDVLAEGAKWRKAKTEAKKRQEEEEQLARKQNKAITQRWSQTY